MNMVKVRWGQAAYNSLAATMVYTQEFKLAEHHLYGSSRLGIKYADTTLVRREFTINGFDTLGNFVLDDVLDSTRLLLDTNNFYRTLALKQYELNSHTQNVLATILDRKTPVGTSNITRYTADVVSAELTYPFHSAMPGKTFTAPNTTEYRFGASNGQEKDNEIAKGIFTADFWEYDSRLGRRWNLDPVVKEWQSPFTCFSNNTITRVDPNGADDFFDQNGNFLFRTKVGNAVQIINVPTERFVSCALRGTRTFKYVEQLNRYLAIYSNSITTLSVTDGNTTNLNQSGKAILGILYHYKKEAKLNHPVKYGFRRFSKEDGTIAETTGPPVETVIAINENTNKISSLLNNSNNIKNLLAHEYDHGWGEEGGPGGNWSPNHLYAYLAQVKHESWAGTTKDWKEVHYKMIGIFIGRAEGEKQEEWKSKFEKELNGTFTKDEKTGDFVFTPNKQ